jgi:hypothetical protein
MLTKLIINERQTMIRKYFSQIDIGNEKYIIFTRRKIYAMKYEVFTNTL